MNQKVIIADAIRLRRAKKEDLPYADLTSREVLIYHNDATNVVEAVGHDGVSVALSIEGGITPTFAIANETELVCTLAVSETKTVMVQVDRDGGLQDAIVVAAPSVPAKMGITVAPIAAGESSALIEISADPDCVAGVKNVAFTLTSGTVVVPFTLVITVTAPN